MLLPRPPVPNARGTRPVTTVPPPAVFVLSIHARYACRRSGACCAAGWDIPIDVATREAIGRAMAERRLVAADTRAPWWIEARGLPPPDVAVLARTREGDCVFLTRTPAVGCRLHAACGPAALPLACRQFPRVTLADDRGLHVTLSHYCPTAAESLLSDDNRSLEVLERPAGWSADGLVPGLDARGHWPPLLRPGVLSTLAGWTAWERFCVAVWARPAVTAASGLAAIAHAARALATWSPGREPLEEAVGAIDVAGAVETAAENETATAPEIDAALALDEWQAAWAAVPAARAERPATPALDRVVDARHALDAAPAAPARYLAARCVASWAAYQGHGLRSFVASVGMAARVLTVEVARAREPDARARLREAIRRADLLLLHLSDPAALAARWRRAEAREAARVCNRRGFRES